MLSGLANTRVGRVTIPTRAPFLCAMSTSRKTALAASTYGSGSWSLDPHTGRKQPDLGPHSEPRPPGRRRPCPALRQHPQPGPAVRRAFGPVRGDWTPSDPRHGHAGATTPPQAYCLCEVVANWRAEYVYLEEAVHATKKRQGKTALKHSKKAANHSVSQPRYCVCQSPDDGIRSMIQCDRCQEWYHHDCLGLDPVSSRQDPLDSQS